MFNGNTVQAGSGGGRGDGGNIIYIHHNMTFVGTTFIISAKNFHCVSWNFTRGKFSARVCMLIIALIIHFICIVLSEPPKGSLH